MIEPIYQYRHKIPVLGRPMRSVWSAWFEIDRMAYAAFVVKPCPTIQVRQVWVLDAEPVATNAELMALLPGAYYMDPPDGGGPGVLEQLQRMAQDAARFRALRAAQESKDPYDVLERAADVAGVRNFVQVTGAQFDAFADALIKELEK